MKKLTLLYLMSLSLVGTAVCAEEAHEQLGRELLEAATEGNAQRVEELLQDSPHLVHDSYDITPLRSAASKGHKEVVETLLRHGAPVDAPTRFGDTALALAVGSHPEIIEPLIRHGADIDHKDFFGDTALIRAAASDNLGSCLVLLQHGADIEATNREGRTPLYIATQRMALRTAKALLDHGADVDAADSNGNTPLALCSLSQRNSWTNESMKIARFKMIQLLVHYGAVITDSIAQNMRERFPGCEPQMEAALAIEKKRRDFLRHELVPVDVANLIFGFEECYENHNCCGCSKKIRNLLTPQLIQVCSPKSQHRVCIECYQEMRNHNELYCPLCNNDFSSLQI